MTKKIISLFILLLFSRFLTAQIEVGLDRLFEEPFLSLIQGKKIGLITNQSALNQEGEQAFYVLQKNQEAYGYRFKVAFAPEHGIEGKLQAYEHVKDTTKGHVPIYSLHGNTKRPTQEMLEGLDVLLYDIQNVGTRCYTYETTLFYAMEEACKRDLQVVVLDRPNPKRGDLVEGLMLEDKYRCFFGYVNVPFCHGMTIGELAQYFNQESNVGCNLTVVPMKGWKRSMTFEDTGLTWSAPSPNMPNSETTLVYPATILIGETLEIVSIDLRGSLPFRRLGAPWISSEELAVVMNQRSLPGVIFSPHTFTPKWGKYKGKKCEGVFLKITDSSKFQPMQTQYILFEEIINLYPSDFDRELKVAVQKGRKKALNYLMGSEELFTLLESHQPISKYMKSLEELQSKEFLNKRPKYLLY